MSVIHEFLNIFNARVCTIIPRKNKNTSLKLIVFLLHGAAVSYNLTRLLFTLNSLKINFANLKTI